MQHVRRLVGFGIVPALSLAASILLLPAISARFGAGGWSSLSLGQGVGAIVAVVVSLAWPVIGGDQVAILQSSSERRLLYRDSIRSRLTILTVLLIPATTLIIAISPGLPLETALFMVGVSTNGMTAAWFFAGAGLPLKLVINEGLVRFAGYLVALVWLLLGAGLWSYAVVLIGVNVVSFVLNWRSIMGRERVQLRGSLKGSLADIRRHLPGTASSLAQAGFTYGGVSIVAVVAPGSLASFAAADQIRKTAGNALAILPSAFVAWVAGGQGTSRLKRSCLATFTMAAVSCLFVALWYVISPAVLSYLFAGEASMDATSRILVGVAGAAFLMSAAVELLLMVPLGRTRSLFIANIVVSVAGLIGLVIASAVRGTIGALTVIVVVTVVKVAYCVVDVFLAYRHGGAGA